MAFTIREHAEEMGFFAARLLAGEVSSEEIERMPCDDKWLRRAIVMAARNAAKNTRDLKLEAHTQRTRADALHRVLVAVAMNVDPT